MLIDKLSEMGNKKFEAWELGLSDKDLKSFVSLNILRIVFRSNKHTVYQVNQDELKRIRELSKVNLDGKLFDKVYGYDKHKELIKKAINSEISILLLGKPSTAKTLFLLELRKLPKSIYLTNDMSLAGIKALIEATNPKYLLIDQLDNIKDKFVYSYLLNLLEWGIDTNVRHSQVKYEQRKVVLFATANSTKRIPEALLSRLLILNFKEYSNNEFRTICEKLMPDKKDVRNKIIQTLIDRNVKDVRTALKLYKICKNVNDVDRYIDIIVL